MKKIILFIAFISILGMFVSPFIDSAEALALTNLSYSEGLGKGMPNELGGSFVEPLSGLDADNEETLELFMKNPGILLDRIEEKSLTGNLSLYWYSYSILGIFA